MMDKNKILNLLSFYKDIGIKLSLNVEEEYYSENFIKKIKKIDESKFKKVRLDQGVKNTMITNDIQDLEELEKKFRNLEGFNLKKQQ